MRTKIMAIAMLSAIMGSPTCAAQANETPSAKSRIDALLKEREKPGHPGCAAGVYQNGSVLYEGAYGLANLEHGVPIDPQRTVFNIASVSKQFTAASILLLVQDGKLKLDDDIRKYLPEIPDYGHTITIDHLLHHTSGLHDYTVLWWMAGKTFWNYGSGEEALNLLSRQTALDFTPGSKFGYSNTGYFLMSVIVQRVSGKSLADFAEERIFAPLGMKSTYFLDSLGRVTPRHASAYVPADENRFITRVTGWNLYGDDGLNTTVGDLAKWQRNFDEPKVGGSWLIQHMEQKGALNNGEEIEYARGLEVKDKGYRGLRTVKHDGINWDGYRADLMRLPSEKFSIAVLCNSLGEDAGSLRTQLADIYMEDKFPMPAQDAAADRKPKASPKRSVSLSNDHLKLLGSYWNREDATARRIERSRGKVWYVRSPESRSELAPIENGQFLMLGVPTRVVIKPMPSNNGRQILQVASDTPAILEKMEPFSPDIKSLNDYAGTYTSPELGGVRWIISVKDGELSLVIPPYDAEAYRPAFKDAFSHPNMILIFQRDTSGRVVSLLADTSRVRNMLFTRVSN